MGVDPPGAERAGPLLRNQDFLRLWLGQVGLALGNGVTAIAMPLLVLALTESPTQAGLVAAARTVPYILIGLPAGALLDRWDRRTVMQWCDLARAVTMASVPIAWYLGQLSIAQLVIVPLIYGSAVSFSNIAQVAALPRLVPRQHLPAAQAYNTGSLGVAALIGPGLGGLVVGLGGSIAEGAALAMLVDAGANLLDLILLASIGRPFQTTRTGAGRPLQAEIAAGLRYLWSDRPIRQLAIINMIHRLCLGGVVVLAVVILGRVDLQADPAALGLIVGAAGAGGLLGALITPWLQRRYRVGRLMAPIVAIHGLGIGLVSLAADVPTAIGGMFVVGIAEAMTSIVQVAYRLAIIPDQMQGRVNSVYRLGSFAAITLGSASIGLLVDRLGPRQTLWLMAGYVLVIAIGVAASTVRRL